MIECSDGVLIDVDKEMAVSMSGTIRKQYGIAHLNLINDQENRENNSQRITVDNITGNTLAKVLDFCSVYTQPHSSSAYKQWHEKFAKLEPAELCELASVLT